MAQYHITGSLQLRKGAWTCEEDDLSRKCIEKHGEGRWPQQVPVTAGLSRCRKCCRLRGMNHLKPNIRRRDFTVDEVDLLVRLHNLLGNRWSLIAGRLPGRTANEIKNYWNTHKRNEANSFKNDAKPTEGLKTTGTDIIKPKPRRITNISWRTTITVLGNNVESKNDNKTSTICMNCNSSAAANIPAPIPPPQLLPRLCPRTEEIWRESLITDDEINQNNESASGAGNTGAKDINNAMGKQIQKWGTEVSFKNDHVGVKVSCRHWTTFGI